MRSPAPCTVRAEIWLQHKASDRKQRELVFKASPDAASRVLNVTVPQRNTHFVSPWAENLGLGVDAAGALTVVMQSNRGLSRLREWGVRRSPRAFSCLMRSPRCFLRF